MTGDTSEIKISDVVVSTAGRDRNAIYFVTGVEGRFLMLVNGREHPLEKPKRKNARHVSCVLPPETRVATKLLAGDKVLNSELRKGLAYVSQKLQGTT